jgi:hypothetical protein
MANFGGISQANEDYKSFVVEC